MRFAAVAVAGALLASSSACFWEGRRGEPVAFARTNLEVLVDGTLVIAPAAADAAATRYVYRSVETFDVTAVAAPSIVMQSAWDTYPFDAQLAEALAHARVDVAGIGACASLVNATVAKSRLLADPRARFVTVATSAGRELNGEEVRALCDGAAPAAVGEPHP